MEKFLLGCNYWASNGGMRMWERFSAEVVEKDFERLSSCGVDTIRVFPTWNAFQPIEDTKIKWSKFRYRINDQPLETQGGLDAKQMQNFSVMFWIKCTAPVFGDEIASVICTMVDGNRSTRHSNTLECRYAVLTAVMNDHKCKNPRPWSGMDYIRGVLRGSHLLAHTWASKPMLQGVFSSAGIKTPPFMEM